MKGPDMPAYIVKVRSCLILGICAIVLIGCGPSRKFGDLEDWMAEQAALPKSQIAPLPEFAPYKPFTYGTANRRSPFEPPVIIPPKAAVPEGQEAVQPPVNKPREYLERFTVGALSMVGTLQQANVNYALVADDRGGVHRVQVGDYMGTDWGEVMTITETRIDIMEIVSDGSGGWLRRPRSVELKSD